MFLDPIQKRAPARSMQLEAVYLEALLYTNYKIFAYSAFRVPLDIYSEHYVPTGCPLDVML